MRGAKRSRVASDVCLGQFMRLSRPITWLALASIGLLVLALLSLPSDPYREPVPPTVTLQGLSRPEAEFLYGHTQRVLHQLCWDALCQLKLKEAWFRFQDARYCDIQGLTKNSDGSVSIVVLHSWPGKQPYTRDMRTTGNWPWKGKQ